MLEFLCYVTICGKFAPEHYLTKFTRKLLYDGMKPEPRYIELVLEERAAAAAERPVGAGAGPGAEDDMPSSTTMPC